MNLILICQAVYETVFQCRSRIYDGQLVRKALQLLPGYTTGFRDRGQVIAVEILQDGPQLFAVLLAHIRTAVGLGRALEITGIQRHGRDVQFIQHFLEIHGLYAQSPSNSK